MFSFDPDADAVSSNAILHRRRFLQILVLAGGLRLLWLLVVLVVPVSDSVRYDFFAQRLATGLGYSEADGRLTAYWPVGPSFLFSLVYRLTGSESDARLIGVAVLNLVLGVGSVALTACLGRRWFSPRVGLTAGLLLACWPSQIQFTTVLASETPMIFFMLAALAVWYARVMPLAPRALLAGGLFAAAAYMRPTTLLLPVVIAICDVLRRERRYVEILTSAGLTIGVMALCIAPWTVRNWRVFGELVPISTNGGVNFWMGNNPASAGGYTDPPSATQFGGEAARDRALKAEAVQYIRTKPLAFIQRTLVKAVRLHERESIGVGWNEPGLRRRLTFLGETGQRGILFGLKLVSNLYWWVMLVLAIVGVMRLARARGVSFTVLTPAFSIWLYFSAVHATTVIQDRYHFAAIPFIACLAAIALAGSCVSPSAQRREDLCICS